MFKFVEALRLMPIEWAQAVEWTGQAAPFVGDVLAAALARAQAVVVLMTPDETVSLREEYGSGALDPDVQPGPQPRPNVLFEAGLAFGSFEERTILVQLGPMRPFSDIAGRHVVRIDESGRWRKD